MPKLTDTQSILLSHAAQRDSLSLYPLPDSVARGARAAKAIGSLITAGFAEERPTSTREAIVRTDGDLTFGVFATDTGLAAIGIEPDAEEPGEPNRRLRAKAVRPRPKVDCAPWRAPLTPPRRPPLWIAATRSTSATRPRALRPCALLRLALPGRTRKSLSSLTAEALSAENGLWCHSRL